MVDETQAAEETLTPILHDRFADLKKFCPVTVIAVFSNPHKGKILDNITSSTNTASTMAGHCDLKIPQGQHS
jgi:hypothetical protein